MIHIYYQEELFKTALHHNSKEVREKAHLGCEKDILSAYNFPEKVSSIRRRYTRIAI
jgi:hypothetical protein